MESKPDLLHHTEVKPTVGYHVQKLFGQNAGDQYLLSRIALSVNMEDVRKRIAISVVRDTKSNALIIKMVNLLPVEVNTAIDLREFGITGSEAVISVL